MTQKFPTSQTVFSFVFSSKSLRGISQLQQPSWSPWKCVGMYEWLVLFHISWQYHSPLSMFQLLLKYQDSSFIRSQMSKVLFPTDWTFNNPQFTLEFWVVLVAMMGYVTNSLKLSLKNCTTLVISWVITHRLLIPHTMYTILLITGAVLDFQHIYGISGPLRYSWQYIQLASRCPYLWQW